MMWVQEKGSPKRVKCRNTTKKRLGWSWTIPWHSYFRSEILRLSPAANFQGRPKFPAKHNFSGGLSSVSVFSVLYGDIP